MEVEDGGGVSNCVIQLRDGPQRLREKVYVGCGAGFGCDRPSAALKLLQRVPELNYLVLECLAERTLADRFQAMVSGGDGYDPRSECFFIFSLVFPFAEREASIYDRPYAFPILSRCSFCLDVYATPFSSGERDLHYNKHGCKGLTREDIVGRCKNLGISTYLGASPIVQCLEKYHPDVVITSRVADASLFLAPMVYELGWDWDDLDKLAQGSLAGHLLECGCQLTGGYFMHPGDKYRDISVTSLLDVSLPYAEICHNGELCVAKAIDSGGELSLNTCAQQLLYEVGDPSAYVTPDVVIDLQDVSFHSLSSSRVLCTGAKPSTTLGPEMLLRLIPRDCGWKAWGEISYGGYKCVERAKAAEYLVRSWMQEACPDVDCKIASYIIGLDSLKATAIHADASALNSEDIRLRMDGLFESKDHAIQFTHEFTALYTNGPAGGGGISTGHKKDIILGKELVARENVFWRTGIKHTKRTASSDEEEVAPRNVARTGDHDEALSQQRSSTPGNSRAFASPTPRPAPAGQKIPLYEVAHSRAGDKGNDSNLSLIPHFPGDVERLKLIITPEWVAKVLSPLLNDSSFLDAEGVLERDTRVGEQVGVEIYEARGIRALNIVVRNILDGGVNCSRRIDRHGKTMSDVLLCQQVVLPPEKSGLLSFLPQKWA
ncbi:unnamed protein product [Linum tenue]|uniref:Uncharacterized protein n=1 Tax=Linum tenue TaxID=586396 RepID=A0AAV0PNM9_9ROSI|nr:unnamed protein product [Linum tenue]